MLPPGAIGDRGTFTAAWQGFSGRPAFDGYPYLVTRIGPSALRHLAVVPADWPRPRLVELLVRQATTNQLSTCLVLGPSDADYVPIDRERDLAGPPAPSSIVPTGLPLAGGLHLPSDVLGGDELDERRTRLRAFTRQHAGTGYLVGDNLEGGREATAAEVARLAAAPGAPGPGTFGSSKAGRASTGGPPASPAPAPRAARTYRTRRPTAPR